MSVPTAVIAWEYLALGDVPVTPAAASSRVHSIETVENLKSSPEGPAYWPARDVSKRAAQSPACAPGPSTPPQYTHALQGCALQVLLPPATAHPRYDATQLLRTPLRLRLPSPHPPIAPLT